MEVGDYKVSVGDVHIDAERCRKAQSSRDGEKPDETEA